MPPGRLSSRTRAAIAKRLSGVTATMNTVAMAEISSRHAWFGQLDAEHRSWITLVAGAGIDGFVTWFANGEQGTPTGIFDAAPRALMRRISLHQTVALVRTTVETVEAQIEELMPRSDRPALHEAIMRYSREVAFAAAEVYARAAELRGLWDSRLEALVVDAVVRGEADESLVSRASTLGWQSTDGIAVAVGAAPAARSLEDLHKGAERLGVTLLAAYQGDRLVVVLGGTVGSDSDAALLVGGVSEHFGPGPIVVGPIVRSLVDAPLSARAAMSGARVAESWAFAPRPVSAGDLLPERALAGDGHARRELGREIYRSIAESEDLLITLQQYFEQGGSIEATARALFVHPNTVRYRLRRVEALTSYAPGDPRDAFVLRLALVLGSLMRQQ
ncbi:PucR family transcriptional regulator [Propionicicella superfundia]|uniref:PucR family transcriptional regulator n=1 Tax=Propionicicella superfundia TaxID=348582 RepID=UPI00040CCEFC|nr:PucR family transcriptional regulator [Propionicicella superfundia]